MEKLIQKLSDMRAVSGSEYRINKEIAALFEPYADEVRIDTLGNVAAKIACGKDGAPSVMLEAHMDEIGLIVTDITDEGFLTVAAIGGVDWRVLPSSVVTVHGKRDVRGIVGIKPGYLQESGKSPKLTDMAVDTGLSAAEVKEIVSIGDGITFPQSVGKLGKKQFSGKTLDDRASVAAIVSAAKRIRELDLNVDVYACAHVQEEVGCRGAKVSAFGINPDMAIAIDVTHGITPDNSERAFKVGGGITISAGPNIHSAMFKRLTEIADKRGIKYAVEVDGGETGTDAWEIQPARNGIPTALLSIPLKYMHTPVETLAISDVEALSDLLVEFVKEQKEDLLWLSFFGN
ncbi:MAG: M20/M25/M40 family metallo-hydrolase [Firmicutes bacterium]|nr:M20/M25/M40 family metallo-hydrolase [Bacillota bacterium]